MQFLASNEEKKESLLIEEGNERKRNSYDNPPYLRNAQNERKCFWNFQGGDFTKFRQDIMPIVSCIVFFRRWCRLLVETI